MMILNMVCRTDAIKKNGYTVDQMKTGERTTRKTMSLTRFLKKKKTKNINGLLCKAKNAYNTNIPRDFYRRVQ